MRPKWILLADDDMEDILMVEEAIVSLSPSMIIRSFPDGPSVLAFIENHDKEDLPAMIVLDFNMPFLNGGEVLLALQNKPDFDHVPKIIWSTSPLEEFREHLLTAGPDRFLIKPRSYTGYIELAEIILQHITGISV